MSNFKESMQKRLREWQGDLEELQVQFNLGKKEAAHRFEEKKKQFTAWLDESSAELKEEFGEGMNELREEYNELLSKLKNSNPADEKNIHKQEQEFAATMDNLEAKAEEARQQGGEKAGKAAEALQDRLARFRAQMNILAVNAKEEATEEYREAKEEAQEFIADFKKKSAEWQSEAREDWQEFRTGFDAKLKKWRSKF